MKILVLAISAGFVALASPAVEAAGLTGENLLAPAPRGFKVASSARNAQFQMTEWVPEGETAAEWSRMVTQQVFFGVRNADPAKFVGGMVTGWRAACPGGESRPVVKAMENSYPVVIQLFSCPMNPVTGKPETMWMKVIGGADSLYSVQYAYRLPAAAALAPPTMQYLGAVSVCDKRRKGAACPPAM